MERGNNYIWIYKYRLLCLNRSHGIFPLLIISFSSFVAEWRPDPHEAAGAQALQRGPQPHLDSRRLRGEEGAHVRHREGAREEQVNEHTTIIYWTKKKHDERWILSSNLRQNRETWRRETDIFKSKTESWVKRCKTPLRVCDTGSRTYRSAPLLAEKDSLNKNDKYH